MPESDAVTMDVLAARINELLVEVWVAAERDAPSYDGFDLTSQQHTVLGLIVTRPEVTPRMLAESLGVTKGAISQHLAILEREGYISRRRSADDGRVQVLQLEHRGQEYADVLRRYEQHASDRYRSRLSPKDAAEIVTALTKLRTAFDS